MKRLEISANRIEILIGLLATALIAAGILLYALQEPVRIASAQQAQLAFDLDEAMSLYAENCSVCHGLAGEGIGATPTLDHPDLRQVDRDTLVKIVARGLYNTSMPAWSKEDGGPLSDYQIDTLVTLIQYGDWQGTRERVINLGLAPQVPFTAQADPATLEMVKALPQGELLAQGITLYAEQCVACHGADGLGTGLAPALNDPAVREKGVDEIERTILNGVSGTLMAAWGNKLSDDEVAAFLALVTRWDEVPLGAIPVPDHPIPVTAESLALGADLYAQNCARCHGPEGQGTRRAPALNVKGYLAETNDAALQQIITLGVSGTAMPSWGDRMTEAEIQAIVGMMRSWEPTAPEVATPAQGGGPWWATTGGTRPGGANALPSGGVKPGGGQGQGQGGGPWWATQGSTPPGGAGGQGQQSTAGGSQAGVETQHQDGTGGGPPWAQQSHTSWLLSLDWRAVVLLGGVVAAALTLMVVAIFGMRRLV